MPAPRILLVKLSSLGDVVHNLPAVTDLAAARPGARIAWMVEEAYVDLVMLHPAVTEAIPVNLRALRRAPLGVAGWRRFARMRRSVRARQWDYVVDTQGLLKSALLARMARAPVFGPDRVSARERIAARFYDVKLAASWSLHAVERSRALMGQIFGYRPQGVARYGLMRPEAPPSWAPTQRYAVMLHAASRAAKRWPDASWIELAKRLAEAGVVSVFPGGTPKERATAARLAAAVPGALAAPAMSIAEAAALLGHADRVVGVDTGLTHLAVAFDVPTVGIYCATRPEETGLHGDAHIVNVGGMGKPPSVDAVAAAAGLEPRTA